MILIYVTDIKYTINDDITFINIEIVALRGRTTAECNRFLMVHLRGYHSNTTNELCQNSGFVKQSTADYPLRSQNILRIMAEID